MSLFCPNEFFMLEHIYRGFFRGRTQYGKEKMPAAPHIQDEFCIPFEAAIPSNNVLGYLRDDVILVDFDTPADCAAFDRILKGLGLVVPTLVTTHGKHYYFKKNANCDKALTKVIIACGLKADFKLGSKRGLDCIKFRGEARIWENMNAPLMELPDWCRPLKETRSSCGESLAELQEGVRNDTLFRYNGRLARSGFSVSDSQNIIRNIINRYVLPYPLSEDDILSVTRDEVYASSFSFARDTSDSVPALESFYDEKTFRHDKLADFLVRHWHVIEVDKATYFFDKTAYAVMDQRLFGKKLVNLYPKLTDNKRKEVYKQLVFSAPIKDQSDIDASLKYISFKNGVLNIETNEMLDHSPKYFIFNTIPHNYNANATSPVAEQFISDFTCRDPEVMNALYELVGHCCYRKNTIRGCFILLGNKRNGKSTFLDYLTYSLGRENVSQIKMQELNERFKTAEIEGKLANIGDDISDEYMQDTNRIKSAVTSNPITVERKGEDPRIIIPYATQIFSANELPRVKDPTGAMLDRLNIIPCKAFFSSSQKNFDPDIGFKLATEEAAEYLLAQGVNGLRRIFMYKQLTQPATARAIVEDYQNATNPVLGFLRDTMFGLDDIAKLNFASVDEVYFSYTSYCTDIGVRATSKDWFVRKLKLLVDNLQTKRIVERDGSKKRIFCKIKEAKSFTLNA